jgi:hypothetical protein
VGSGAVQGPAADQGTAGSDQVPFTTPLPVGSLPGLSAPATLPAVPAVPSASPSLSPGGNAAGLFPTLDPKPAPSSTGKERARPVANTSALPEGAPVAGAQLAGLAALVLAFVLTVTRLSIRRRSAPAKPPAGNSTSAEEAGQPAKDAAQPGSDET